MSLYFLWWVMKISESSSTKGNYTRPFELRTAVVATITAMIVFTFIPCPVVLIYKFHAFLFYLNVFTRHSLIKVQVTKQNEKKKQTMQYLKIKGFLALVRPLNCLED